MEKKDGDITGIKHNADESGYSEKKIDLNVDLGIGKSHGFRKVKTIPLLARIKNGVTVFQVTPEEIEKKE